MGTETAHERRDVHTTTRRTICGQAIRDGRRWSSRPNSGWRRCLASVTILYERFVHEVLPAPFVAEGDERPTSARRFASVNQGGPGITQQAPLPSRVEEERSIQRPHAYSTSLPSGVSSL